MNHTLETKEAHLLYSYLSRCKTSIPKTVPPFLSFFFNRERKSNSNSFNNISSYSVLFITQSHVSHAHTECRLNPNSNLSYRLWPTNFYSRHVVFAQNYYTYTEWHIQVTRKYFAMHELFYGKSTASCDLLVFPLSLSLLHGNASLQRSIEIR